MTMENTSFSTSKITQRHGGTGFISKIVSSAAEQMTGAMHRLQKYRQQRIDRRAFDNLLTLDDFILSDIGVNRDDVEWASKLPIHKNAAVELRKISDQSRHKQTL